MSDGREGRPRGLDALFTPRTVAVIGASSSPDKASHMPLRNLLANGFPGEIFPINPGVDEILGVRTHPSIVEVPNAVDLAYIVIPAEGVLAELERCAEAGVGCAIVAVSGFAETDSDEGRARQARIAEIAARSGMRILGPNTNGLYNTAARMSLGYNAANERRMRPGVLSIISHSGALFNAIAGRMVAHDVGLNAFVSVGNEADITMLDLVEHSVLHSEAQVIAMIMESVRDGHRLRGIVEAARMRGKRLVALKLGRSAAGARATVAHSSRLAGSSAAYQAWLEDAGVPVIRTIEGIAGMAAIVEHSPVEARSGALGVITFSGGGSALVVDTASDLGLPIAEVDGGTVERLQSYLTRPGVVMNPLDMGAGIPMDRTQAAMAAVSGDAAVGASIVFLHSMQTPAMNVEIAEAIAGAQRETGVPHSVLAPGRVSDAELAIFREAGIAVFTDTVTCVAAVKPLLELAAEPLPPPVGRAGSVALPRGVIDERAGLELLARFGVPAVVPVPVRSAEQAVAAAEELGGPVVLKGLAEGIAHKGEAGLVRLGLHDAAAVAAAYTSLRERLAELAAREAEIIVERAVPASFEVYVGCSRQPGIGHVLVAGLGGVYTEALQQVVLWSLPVPRGAFERRLRDSPLGRVLRTLESTRPTITGEFLDVLDGIQQLVLTVGDSVQALDVNPVLLSADGPVAVDALVVVSGTD